jgi:hypothetical protein
VVEGVDKRATETMCITMGDRMMYRWGSGNETVQETRITYRLASGLDPDPDPDR